MGIIALFAVKHLGGSLRTGVQFEQATTAKTNKSYGLIKNMITRQPRNLTDFLVFWTFCFYRAAVFRCQIQMSASWSDGTWAIAWLPSWWRRFFLTRLPLVINKNDAWTPSCSERSVGPGTPSEHWFHFQAMWPLHTHTNTHTTQCIHKSINWLLLPSDSFVYDKIKPA